MTRNLRGKKVVIFGGSSGVGLAAATALASCDAYVIIASRSEEKLARAREQIGAGAEAHRVDITDEAAVMRFFDQIGMFDHLVVTATVSMPGRIMETDVAVVRKNFETKFWGQYHAARHGAPHLNPGGSITLFSGISSRKPALRNTILSAQNGAIEAFARALALELAPLRVNVVAAGLLDTPFWEKVPAERREALFAATAENLPVRRVGTAEDCANAVLFLISTGFVTGTVVDVDGGASLV